ncbi:hypothetical protein ACFY05_31995 [Microtetraspora fusca]|uniref:FtsK domain-containing protein n=1 Tax=Microtetraspora fusca TaxID=1997 RepID=A0ABW6VGX1_MICFU
MSTNRSTPRPPVASTAPQTGARLGAPTAPPANLPAVPPGHTLVPKEPAGPTVGGELQRAAKKVGYRIRYGAAPLMTMGGLWGATAWATTQAGMGPVTVGAGTVALAAAPLIKKKLRLAVRKALCTMRRKVWAGGALTAATTWTMAAAEVGVGFDTLMPAALVVGGSVISIPFWWRYRNQIPAAPLKAVEPPPAQPALPAPEPPRELPPAPHEDQIEWDEFVGCSGGALPGTCLLDREELFDLDGNPNGSAWTIKLVRGKQTTMSAIAQSENIQSAYDTTGGLLYVERHPSGKQSLARLVKMTRNPLSTESIIYKGPRLDLKTGIAPISLYPDGSGYAYYRFWEPKSGSCHTLVSGTTGAGKSGVLTWIITEAAESGVVATWLLDPQHGISVPAWVKHVDRAALEMEEIKAYLYAAAAVLEARGRYQKTLRWYDAEIDEWCEGKGFFEPTPEYPLLMVVIDEAHKVLLDQECVNLVAYLAKEGRKVGIKIVLATQVPSVTELGGNVVIRDQVASGNIIVLRTANRLSGQMAYSGSLPIDPGAIPKVFEGTTIPTKGLGYVLSATERPVPSRVLYVRDAVKRARAVDVKRLDAMSEQAAAAILEQMLGAPRAAGAAPGQPVAPVVPLHVVPVQGGDDTRATAKHAVLDYMRRVGRPVPAGEFNDNLEYSPAQIHKALNALKDTKQIRQGGWGQPYELADSVAGVGAAQ